MGHDELDDLIAALTRLAFAYDLDAAHAAEFIPESIAAPALVSHAFESAIASGAAIGLRRAIEVIEERRQD